jgi:hypothetical protein
MVGEPVHVPVVAVYDEMVIPSKPTTSTIAGNETFAGTLLATTGVELDSLVADPRLFVPVTTTRSVDPTSAVTGT